MFSLGLVYLKVSPKQPSGMYVCMYVYTHINMYVCTIRMAILTLNEI